MRLVSALLFVALTGSIAVADEAKPADSKPEVSKRKVPLRVVRILSESHQVLLFDKNRGTHVVAEVGQDVDGFVVDEIDDDEVTLIAPNGSEVILAGPDATWRKRADARKSRHAARQGAADGKGRGAAAGGEPQPLDPYADAETSASTATPITAGEGGVRVASASEKGPSGVPVTPGAEPADPYGDPAIAAFVEAVGAARPTSEPAAKPAKSAATKSAAGKSTGKTASAEDAGSLAAAATGSRTDLTESPPSEPAKPAATSVTISRNEVDSALADFGATAVTFDAAFIADGLRFDHIASGTILAKLGLRAGDVLSAVDHRPLRSLDDAASLYARAGTARSATLSISRGGKPVTLKVAIR